MRLALLAVLPLAACVAEPEPPSGASLFAQSCAVCHGPDGRGTGRAAAGQDVAPPDLTTIAARNGGVFPRNQVMSIIDGYRRGQHFSPAMPEFGAGDLGRMIIVENPDGTGTPIPENLLALADYLESIQREASERP
jgi:mono/diheme cytochrome c family protein